MIYLQITQKVLEAMGEGDREIGPGGETEALLGCWMAHVVPMGSREAVLFMSTRTLLSFPIMLGKHAPTLDDLTKFLLSGLDRLALIANIPDACLIDFLAEVDQMCVCSASDKSQLALMKTLAGDYAQYIKRHGGIANVDMDAMIKLVNDKPRKTLGFKTAIEACSELV